MRMYQIISEDALADQEAFGKAHAIRGTLIRYLLHGSPNDHYGFKGRRFADGEVMLCLQGEQIGLQNEDAKIWFRFAKQQGYAVSGNISKFQRSGEPIITVYCLEDLQNTETAAKTIIYRHPVHDVLIHELIHYLDSARNSTMYSKSTGEDKQGKAEYYNDPAEFNAFFHNLAQPLLAFLEAARNDAGLPGLTQFAKAQGIDLDFKETLAMLIQRAQGQANPALKRYWTYLLPDRRRRVIRRLYALHQQVIATLKGTGADGT
jgi:hypothetical protein